MQVKVLRDCLIVGARVFAKDEIVTRDHAPVERLKSLVEDGHAAHTFAPGQLGTLAADDLADDDDDSAEDLEGDDEDEAPAPDPIPSPARRGRRKPEV